MATKEKHSCLTRLFAAAVLTTISVFPASGVPSDPTGTPAYRIADMMEIFGANVYFNRQDHNDGDTADGITAAAKYIIGDSGMTMMYRGYAGRIADFSSNGPAVFKATGGRFCLCMDVYNLREDTSKVIALAKASVHQGGWIQFIEGANEPDGGFPQFQSYIPPERELAAQREIYHAVHPLGIKVAAPSVTLDTHHITNYWGTNLSAVIAASDLYNTHLYPNFGGPNSAHELYDFSQAVSKIWDNKPGIMSEWQPTLYNNDPTDDLICAYWTPIALLSGFVDMKLQALLWWEIFDYPGFSPHVGLFSRTAANPYPAAKVMKAMYALTGDTGSAKHTFTPGKLNFTITGLPAGSTQYNRGKYSPFPNSQPSVENRYNGGRYAVFQNSAPGTFFLFIWNEQNRLNFDSTNLVKVVFNDGPMLKVEDYSLTRPVSESPVARQTITNAVSVTIDLTSEVRLLRISHPH